MDTKPFNLNHFYAHMMESSAAWAVNRRLKAAKLRAEGWERVAAKNDEFAKRAEGEAFYYLSRIKP